MASLFRFLLLFLSKFFILSYVETVDTNDYDAYGERLAMNEYFGVLASNDYRQFNLFFAPYSLTSCSTSVDYKNTNEYVYTVAIGSKQNSSQLYFTAIGEIFNSSTSPTIQSYIAVYSFSTCGAQLRSEYWPWNQTEQRTAVLGVDPYGLVAYAVNPSELVYLDLTTNTVQSLAMCNGLLVGNFAPRSIVVDQNQTAHIVGYLCSFMCSVVLLRQWFDSSSGQSYCDVSPSPSITLALNVMFTSYDRDSDMSLSINLDSQQLLVGVPYFDTVYIGDYWSYATSPNRFYNWSTYITSSQLKVGFGKSVAWINNSTAAILTYSLSTLPWSTSQLQIHQLTGLNFGPNVAPHPQFVFPNNQQVLWGAPLVPLPTALLSVVSWSVNSLAVLTDAQNALIVPMSLPGSASSNQVPVSSLPNVFLYESQPCIPGTENNQSSCGPCFICPMSTKNNGSFGVQCETCANNSFCPLGSTTDIEDESTTSYDQAYPYPASPEATHFEDVLLNRIFSFGSTSHCLLMSPLFWACFLIGLASIIILLMAILVFFPKHNRRRQVLKHVFMHCDLVGEGEMWIGGLVSVAIAVLLTFAYVFISSYVHLYPIEDIPDNQSSFSCDPTMRNAKFSSSLQLLSIQKLEEEKPIFEMLNNQSFVLSIEFVNTGFNCDALNMQRNFGQGSRSIVLTDFNCSIKPNNATLLVSTILAEQLMTIQYNLTGPYFIGGVRICFSGDPLNNILFTLKELNFCQFFSTVNQTLASLPYVTVEMTKTINRTVAFSADDAPRFAGLWLPALTIQPISDGLVYEQDGDYTRYVISQTTLVVDIGESKFYVKNIQEPIVRENEIIFEAVLFTIMCIEIFGLLFLIVKLTIVPLIRTVQHRFLRRNKKTGVSPLETEENESQAEVRSVCSERLKSPSDDHIK